MTEEITPGTFQAAEGVADWRVMFDLHSNRIHVDVSVPHDHTEARVAAGAAVGGRVVLDH